ncbi:MAG: rhomboid family intramembrane serine protease [Syntrophorhabdaceae bacterium]
MALRYIIILSFVTVYILYGRELGFTDCSPLWTHFTYSFQHASIIHLVVNCLVFFSVSQTMIRLIKPYVLFPIIYIIAVLTSFAAMKDIPTVGASGMIYAVFGMQTVIVVFNKATAKQKRLFFFGIALMLTVSFFNGGSSFIVHAASFTYGALFWLIKRSREIFSQTSLP